ncbi:MAG: uroporphyrinogen-III synthase [Planctomycetes bacterium]|nr:uroporphyrinogen-III synthase [Planctomycetota bacterium]
MSAARPRPVVVVATEETAAAWARSVEAAGRAAVALAFARAAPPADLGAVTRALAQADLVLATSANAARYLPAGVGGGRPAAAVGAATARALEAVGFRVDVRGDGGAEALARALVRSRARGRVLWLRGERAREDGAAVLRDAGFVVDEVVAYAVEDDVAFPAAVRATAAAAYVVGSPAAARALAAAVSLAGVPCVAVGDATAQALRAEGADDVSVASRPTAADLARAVEARLSRGGAGPRPGGAGGPSVG